MSRVTQQPASLPASTAEVEQFTGEVVFLYAFDVAYEMARRPVATLLGQHVAEFVVEASKRGPRQLLFYRPQMVRLPAMERLGPQGPVRIERAIKLLPVGAISITVRVPFRCHSLPELVAFHDLRFANGSYLHDEVRELAEQVRRELAPHLVRPVEHLADEEAYTVFCINGPFAARGNDGAASPENVSAEDWLLNHRREVAKLLTEEAGPAQLSEQEATESTGLYFSYYDRDLVVIDWDSALVIDEPRYFDETLYVMELANVQLAELEAYDRILDAAVERSYRDVGGGRTRGPQATRVQRELREIRIDLARMSDELSNITKFFGDWHLARIYQGLSARFHLGDWHRTIDDKLKTLDDLYQLLRTEQSNRWMLFLEASMALLFVIDLVLLVIGLKK
ncbi:MAG TPA: hypothetical protein VG269_24320 [Tepidisphaeraceae bacterium]|jgi:hypothetical protein|nr:hypothetical protein [Tepidisphaeraceae bacterium]